MSEIEDILKQSIVDPHNASLHSLTKIHSLVSGKRSKCPYVWLKTKQAKECIRLLENSIGNKGSTIVDTKYRQSTLAHTHLAVLYMMWLDASKMVHIAQAFIEKE